MRARCGTFTLRLLPRSGIRGKIFSCFAGPCHNTIEAPPKDGTEVPKQHSKSIRAASAATASGFLETVLSKLTRRSTVAPSSSSLHRVTSDRSQTFIDQWHGLLEPRDPGAVPSPVGRLEARDRWRNGWDAAGAVVPRRRQGPAFGTGIGGAARLAPRVM